MIGDIETPQEERKEDEVPQRVESEIDVVDIHCIEACCCLVWTCLLPIASVVVLVMEYNRSRLLLI